MKHLRSIFFLCLVLSLLSCKKDNPYEKYQGTWSGNYTGDDTGKWIVDINNEGNVEGTATSDSLQNFPFPLSGKISENGTFSASVNIFVQTIVFEGKLSNDKASGTWINSTGISGTWNGEKK